jgi:hypothetical protein
MATLAGFLQALEEAKHLTVLADRMPAAYEKHGRYGRYLHWTLPDSGRKFT